MVGFKFGPQARLDAPLGYRRVFSQGRRVSAHRLFLWHYEHTEPVAGPRLGLSVNAKIGNAVVRNRMKRLVRETFRLRRGQIKQSADLVVCLRPGCQWKDQAAAEKDLLALWKKAGILSA